MDIRALALIIVVVAVILGYFLFLAPKSGSNPTTSIITVSTIPNSTTNSTNSTTNQTKHNSTSNYSASEHTWLASPSYPLPVGNSNCDTIGNFIYCIGGQIQSAESRNYTSRSYYSRIDANGLTGGGWVETIPAPIAPTSCVTYANTIYCITGKLLSNYDDINTTYYSHANSSGLSYWTQSTSYPINVSTSGCALSGILIYCVGGFDGTNRSYTSRVYYATISKGGIGLWTESVPLPIPADPQCYAHSSTLYCLGTYLSTNGTIKNFNFYAIITYSGLSSWKSTTGAPNKPYDYGCSFNNPFVYCIGNFYNFTNSTSVYYTGLSNGGVNGWHEGPMYPLPLINSTSCATYINATFCIGGRYTNATFTNYSFYTRALPT